MDHRLKAQANAVRAIALAGGAAAMSRALSLSGPKITNQAVWQWNVVPISRAREVSALTGIPLHNLRPDVWDAPPAAAKKQPELSTEA